MVEVLPSAPDRSTVMDLLQHCPHCRMFPHVHMGFSAVAIQCTTTACPAAVDKVQYKYWSTLDEAIAKWNSLVIQYYVRPAVVLALVNAGIYTFRRK